MKLYKRLTYARKGLHLSKNYVARRLDITVPQLNRIEAGKKQPTEQQLYTFNKLYSGIVFSEQPNFKLPKEFKNVNEHDKIQILNLLAFKHAYKRASKERK